MKQGWELKKLEDVCYCKSSNVSQNKLVDEIGDYPIFGASGLIKNVSFYHRDKPYLSIVKDGSGFGRITKMDAFTSVIGTLQYILPNDEIDLDYLNYSLMSVDFKKYVQGAAIPHIYFKDYKNEPFLWMPLPEQQRIVAKLDEAFAVIAKAKANAEQNLKNAKELFESYKNELFDNKGKGYIEIALKEICDKITQGPNPKYDKNENEKFRVLKTKNLYDKNIFYEEADKVSESVFNTCLSSELKDGDVLLAIVGQGSINKCNVFENKTPYRFIYTRALGLIRTNNLKLNPYFLKAFLQSKRGKDLIDYGIGGTSGQQVVTTTHIKALKIPLPSLKEQQIIIQKLDALSIEVKKLEVIYQKKINDLEELKKSVLQKAFSGELKTEKIVV